MPARGESKLPSEAELCARWSVSRVTIRKALDVLRREGLIVGERGQGTFLKPSRIPLVLGTLGALDDSVEEVGLEPSYRVIEFKFTSPTPELCATLGLEPSTSTVLELKRLHSVGGEPMVIFTAFIPEALGAQLSRHDVESQRLFDLLPNRFGVKIGRAAQRIRAAVVAPMDASLLRIATGDPILLCERVVFDADDRPVFMSLFVLRADKFEFRVTLPWAQHNPPGIPPGVILTDSARGDAVLSRLE